MKKQITTITLGILMIASAMAMFSGESMTFETELINPVYTVYGNSSDLSGLTVEFENGNITVMTNSMMDDDSFTLVFFDEVTREVIKTVNGGGSSGGSSTRYVDRNVTVYVPEYINDTETIYLDNIITEKDIEFRDTGFTLTQIIIAILIGISIAGLGYSAVSYYKNKKEGVETVDYDFTE